MEKGSNEAMYVISLVVLMVSAGHNSLQRTRTQAQMNAHTRAHTDAQSNTFDSLSVSLCLSYPPFGPVQRRYMEVWNTVTLTFWA